MAADVIVRPLAEADVREAAFWYERKREGLGAELTLELDAIYDRIGHSPRQFPEIGTSAGGSRRCRRARTFSGISKDRVNLSRRA